MPDGQLSGILGRVNLTMANPHSKSWTTQQRIKGRKNFRILDTSLGLEEQGFKRGLPCPYEHTIRDVEQGWCYQCLLKIQTSLVGLDINYLHEDFQPYAHRVLEMVDVRGATECWPIKSYDKAGKPKRIVFPDYRQDTKAKAPAKVTIKKVMYTLFWGDVGQEVVTNYPGCTDPNCANPLHLCSIYNRDEHPRKAFNYFDLEPNPEKLNLLLNRKIQGYNIEDLLQKTYRPAIAAI